MSPTRAVLVLGVVALALSGCSDSDEDLAAVTASTSASGAASTPATPVAPATPTRASTSAKARTKAAPAAAAGSPTEQLCGHKSMNGRACTREAGHSEKSHRYS